jgi:hypothetical protein
MLFRNIFNRFTLLLLLSAAAGCNADKNIITPVYNSYAFDTLVIKKLPLYDSLATAISKNLSVLLKATDTSEYNGAFRYMPVSNDPGVLKKLPENAAPEIGRYYAALGGNFIFGFDLFRDSTIKIYIRRRLSEMAPVDIEENLAYYPSANGIKKRTFPVKDTVLNKYWQYYTRFNKQGFF